MYLHVGEIRVVQGSGKGSNSFLYYNELYRAIISQINDDMADRVTSADQI